MSEGVRQQTVARAFAERDVDLRPSRRVYRKTHRAGDRLAEVERHEVEAALRHVHPRWIGVTPSASISQPLLVHTRLRKRVGLGPAGRGRRNARAGGASELPAQLGDRPRG